MNGRSAMSWRGAELTSLLLFFFNDTATTEIYTLSLHDALPIWGNLRQPLLQHQVVCRQEQWERGDRKSTRLNSSHANISYAVFCLKKKYIQNLRQQPLALGPENCGDRHTSLIA